jgi:hypothetical protein
VPTLAASAGRQERQKILRVFQLELPQGGTHKKVRQHRLAHIHRIELPTQPAIAQIAEFSQHS